MELDYHKVRHVNTVSVSRLRKFFKFQNQQNVESCEPNSSMLGTELAYDPNIKVVTLEFNNFILGYIAMQSF